MVNKNAVRIIARYLNVHALKKKKKKTFLVDASKLQERKKKRDESVHDLVIGHFLNNIHAKRTVERDIHSNKVVITTIYLG